MPTIHKIILAFVMGAIFGTIVTQETGKVIYTELELDEVKYLLAAAEPAKEFRVTAYCPCSKCCGKWSDGITASGHIIKTGDKFVAAPPGYSFGTMVEIPGYGKVPVLDRGGAIKGNRLDCYFDTHQEALNFGVQRLKVRIL